MTDGGMTDGGMTGGGVTGSRDAAIRQVRLRKDAYVDSVLQLAATRAMRDVAGVEWAAAAMGTPANLETLAEQGFTGTPGLAGASANDCLLAVVAVAEVAAAEAVAAGEAALSGGGPRSPYGAARDTRPRSLADGVAALVGANLAIVSVPGPYAALEAHKALSAGLHVLLFSDNVSVDDEVELKARAAELGLLVMGPGAGTAALGGTGLAFANRLATQPGPGTPRVGIVAAAGTGAQEAMSLLDRYGVSVAAVVGVGGRDLSEAVGGTMARQAVRTLAGDPGVDAVLLVSKPPAEAVARAVVAEAGDTPLVAALIGLAAQIPVPPTVRLAATLEEGVLVTLEVLGRPRPDVAAGWAGEVAWAAGPLGPYRRLVRGLYSGGTLCYEALVLMSGILGPVYSNTPLRPGWDTSALSSVGPEGAHTCLDLGEEEYTRGRPHPMIDPEARIELLRSVGAQPRVAAVLLDVVLGDGAHGDPAGLLAPACADLRAGGEGPAVVAYVLGTEADPQGLARQRATLAAAGCLVAPTGARAALAAAALATRRPEVAAR